MTQKFNILHVVSRLPVGGVENMIMKVVSEYDKSRFNASICCIKEGGAVAEDLIRSGYRVDILNKMKSRSAGWDAVTAVYHILKRDNIHIIRTHQYHANLYGRLAGILARVPVIIPSFHNIYVSPDQPKLHRRIFNHILSYFSSALVAVSSAIASDIMRYDRVCPKKIKVIHNGIKLDNFDSALSKNEARKLFNLPEDTILIGAVGRLTPQKGQRYLIEALSEINNTAVAIAGDGPLINELKNLATRLNVNCIFTGKLHHDKIPLFLRAADIYCIPSLWEGMPSALVEAMASGLPIIASDILPHKEVLNDAGIFVPSEKAATLAEKIRQLIRDPSLRDSLAQKAKERSRIFSIKHTVKSYENLYEEILRKKKLL